ncbi:hypothetical protein HCCG_01259 [Helicobacter cinaedi CCUG 18818 = ATCC BAA-847]|uniref:Uncharacterized protein n=1 Tax=Helicobacter cinaedi CCUG 18818 = ATCC BAA-847 TaxID=537971 RepID=A0ABN0BBG9_9HELI|nr:hypothetical protein HCCG_01259 [Helicobacter cinaedi CCUG 18818 = ATCC BAA-847]
MKQKNIYRDISINFLHLDNLLEKVIDRTLSIDVRVKSIAGNFF